MTPFLSTSASVKASRKKVRKRSRNASLSLASVSSRSEAAATMLSEATAVSIEIIVHEPKLMKKTKKICHRQSVTITGPATSIQLSSVVTWKRVKIDVGTSPKFPWTSGWSAGHSCLRPISWVHMMAHKRMNRKRTPKITPNASIMLINACANAATRLAILRNLSKRKRRTNLMALNRALFSGIPRSGRTTSKAPPVMVIQSRAVHNLSCSERSVALPKRPALSPISRAKPRKKATSQNHHAVRPG
mmetsp:Transcript_6882/g.16255  ORF Transcript_6882/g.16255 Transcript_6882/m.16255 type:complete len:246 (+) Transcript_6882:589-1326(+)